MASLRPASAAGRPPARRQWEKGNGGRDSTSISTPPICIVGDIGINNFGIGWEIISFRWLVQRDETDGTNCENQLGQKMNLVSRNGPPRLTGQFFE